MEEANKTVSIMQEILKLAEEKGWSEKELAKAVALLDSTLDTGIF